MSEKIKNNAAAASLEQAVANAGKEQNKPAFSKEGQGDNYVPTIDRLQKKPTAHAILGAYGAKYPSDHQDKSRTQKPTWNMLTKLKTEIGHYIGQMAEDINTSVEMVKMVGCDHVQEFNVAVEAANKDFQGFIKDFNTVAEKHEGREGIIKTPDDLALSIQIFEDYNQFRAKFEGTMHHALIGFTEYSLEARDRLVANEQAKLAAEQPAAVEEPQAEAAPVEPTKEA